ncbi:hypothetical protein TNCV_5086781 [Trichonephila clavipes]|nr:hypothetical protein TNCV_5086781 [Trichonephila clavipes]
MWVRRGSTSLMAGKVVFLRGLLSPIRVVDLTESVRVFSLSGHHDMVVSRALGLVVSRDEPRRESDLWMYPLAP